MTEIATVAGAPIAGASSVKAALDLNWDDPQERQAALTVVLQALNQAEAWMAGQSLSPVAPVSTQAQQAVAVARPIEAQDMETTQSRTVKLRQGVSKDRRISIEDGQMRQGRKSKRHRFDGYKRHLLHDRGIRINQI